MWLFSGNGMKKEQAPAAARAASPAADATAQAAADEAIDSATGDDHEEWMKYLATRDPRSRKPGMSIKDEYAQWMVARVKKRAAASSSKKPV
jgi:hypothetical protein